jgi:hypothetical protein
MIASGQRKIFWSPALEVSLLISVILFLFAAPWFYGLTRTRDQLASEILTFGAFLFFFLWADSAFFIHPKNGLFHPIRWTRSVDGWLLMTLVFLSVSVFFSTLPYRSFLALLRFFSLFLFFLLVRLCVRTQPRLFTLLRTFLILGTVYSI